MPQYSLRQHIYMCKTREYVVFLDVKNDAYLGISLAQMNSVGTQLHGWQPLATESSDQVRSTEYPDKTHTALEDLIRYEIVTGDHQLGKLVVPTSCEAPNTALIETIFINTLLDDDALLEPKIRLQDVWYFFRAYVTAATMKRCWSLDRIVQHVRARKERLTVDQLNTDIALARTAAWIFRRIRPFGFSKKSACFLESLALLEFLSYYAVFPSWIFGVQTGPFRAHCWVQAGDVVFNDSPFVVRPFTPILAA